MGLPKSGIHEGEKERELRNNGIGLHRFLSFYKPIGSLEKNLFTPYEIK